MSSTFHLSRRMLIFSPLSLKKPHINNRACPMQIVDDSPNDKSSIYISKNKKFGHSIMYHDIDGVIRIDELIEWIDPFTDEKINRRNQTIYITELNENVI